ncbi:sugar/nucleoside kinase (ribokinase family) [Luteibacter sp. OK325]|uniref:carbohydrate kinase family protein n=1 Tax=Luteibacter sp. OK325 TaxID=2135670 RepID=UPI000D49077A|nr:carbohydrate kinase family protein [Luteibacter sp. OK325]PTR34364.1 sugar/nucleoside kinase (ribokinase family) [Luteibacter sp. OK325]
MAIPATLKSWDVAVVGEIYADHVFSGFPQWPGPGEEVIAENYLRELGGGAINTACALSRLGRRVRLVGLIGEADLDWFESRLGDFGVSMDGIRLGSDGTGITVSVSTVEDRSFFTYAGVNRALPELLASPEIVADLAAARHVHFAMPLPRDLAAILLPLLRQAGCTTSLDVGYSPAWLRDPVNRPTFRDLDLFLPNAKEAALLSGDEEPSSFEAWSIGAGIGRAVMKQGAGGAWIADERGLRRVPAPRIDAVDSTGAGDAFDAGLIDGLLDGDAIDGCVERGCVCGALCTTAAGALQALPHSPQLRTLREQTYGS